MATRKPPAGTYNVIYENPTLLPVSDVHPNPKNPRVHDMPSLITSFREFGQTQPIIVNAGTQTGRPNEIVAGHGRLKAVLELGWTHIGVVMVDVQEKDYPRLLAVDNRTSELGSFDDRLLAELLGDIEELNGDLSGTGYDSTDLEALLESLDEFDTPPPPTSEPADDEDGGGPATDWAGKSRRVMVIDLPVDLFVWLQKELQTLGEARNLDSNAAVIVSLVSEYSDTEPPSPAESAADTEQGQPDA